VEPYDPAAIHGVRLPADEIDALVERIAPLDLHSRSLIPGLPRERADVIVAGALILARVCQAAEASEVRISDGGLRVGLGLEIMEESPIDPTSGSG
jgi:exopolyphosphatase/guanosine-5'-triphosphate,3'-diphosphate pyrophosphatase